MTRNDSKTAVVTLSFPNIGFVVFIVFLILKLCNINNPDYEWLTWFWVWFPLWIPWAIYLVLSGIIVGLLVFINKRLE